MPLNPSTITSILGSAQAQLGSIVLGAVPARRTIRPSVPGGSARPIHLGPEESRTINLGPDPVRPISLEEE